jgi:hypothetical protein
MSFFKMENRKVKQVLSRICSSGMGRTQGQGAGGECGGNITLMYENGKTTPAETIQEWGKKGKGE